MEEVVRRAFADMLDVSSDIDKAILFSRDEVLASNMPEEVRPAVLAQARELIQLAESRAREMGSPSPTQVVVETPNGYVFVVRELRDDGMAILATGKKRSHVGLVLYDLRTCIRDIREGTAANETSAPSTEEV
ncbi:MAG: roadblock/LC7 domain-containing protein [Thermoleophilia bacterium]|nr:roadblock/LC7 domain-containing protein [Thermoleophilia bacterium]